MVDFVPVSWSVEPVSVEKLRQMAANEQALLEMKTEAAIKHNGVNRNRGMKVLAGSQLFQPSNTWSTRHSLYFGNYFSVGCSPIVIPSVYSHPQTGVNLTPTGLSGTKVPDHRGFSVYIWTDDRNGFKGTLKHPYYITYIAVGF